MRILLFVLFLFCAAPVLKLSAQSKEEIQKQMQGAINELNKQITDLEKQIAEAKKNKEDPESIKQMEDELALLKKQLAMMGGLTKNVSRISEKTIQAAGEQENTEGFPKRDNERINALPKKPLNDAELSVFVQKLQSALENKISVSQKNNAKEAFPQISNKEFSPQTAGVIAVQCWMAGSTDMAIYLMGKACVADMSNPDNLSNYAAFLSMTGGEHLAIPILQNLQKKYPENTTVMNNLGQAWYGLGEMNNAKTFLDNTEARFPGHPYVNETKAEIDRSQGRDQESTEELKISIREDYTTEKEARLNARGVKIKYDDIHFKYPGPAAPLAFSKFLSLIPDYPMDGGATAQTARYAWDDFRNKTNDIYQALSVQHDALSKKVKAFSDDLMSKTPEEKNEALKPYNNKVYKTANRKLQLLIERETDRFVQVAKKLQAAQDTVRLWKDEYYKQLGNTKSCDGRLSLARDFNARANTLFQTRNNEMINFQKQYLEAQARLYLYAFFDRSAYEESIVGIKMGFLSLLMGLNCECEVGCIPTKPQPPGGGTLPDFDVINCQYKTELSIPYMQKLFSIQVECNKMTTKFDLKFIKGSLEENLANGKYHGTVEVEEKIGSDNINLGPLKLGGSKISAGAGVDFNEGGIQDVYITGRAQVSATGVGSTSADVRVSVISGNTSVVGKGALSGISIGTR